MTQCLPLSSDPSLYLPCPVRLLLRTRNLLFSVSCSFFLPLHSQLHLLVSPFPKPDWLCPFGNSSTTHLSPGPRPADWSGYGCSFSELHQHPVQTLSEFVPGCNELFTCFSSLIKIKSTRTETRYHLPWHHQDYLMQNRGSMYTSSMNKWVFPAFLYLIVHSPQFFLCLCTAYRT